MAIIMPEIFSQAVNEKLDVFLRIGRVAYNATDDVDNGAIREAGSTIHFPTINRVAKAVEVVKGTPLVPATLDMTDTTAVIKHMAVPFRVYDVEQTQIKGNAKNAVVEQVATEMARQIDFDLTTAMDSDAVFKTPTAASDNITLSELYDAVSYFDDNIDTNTFAGIVINSRLWNSFIQFPEFIKSNYSWSNQDNGVVRDGVIGYLFGGIPVLVSNNGTYDDVADECKTYFVKKNALGYILQKDITLEEQRNALLLATDVVASSLYATKLLDSKGCVILRKTA